MQDKIRHLSTDDKGKAQFLRFVLNGCFSAAVHYTIYFLCQLFIEVNISYAIGYVLSFLVNYYTTCRFTFRQQPTWKHFIGFSGSHAINFCLAHWSVSPKQLSISTFFLQTILNSGLRLSFIYLFL